jgi:hypothetical protein
MTTAEAGAFILSSEYQSGDFEEFISWLTSLADDLGKAALMRLLELLEEYDSLDEVPPDEWDRQGLQLAQAILWQTGIRDEKPEGQTNELG